MKFNVFIFILFVPLSFFAQKKHSIFYENGNSEISLETATELTNYFNAYHKASVQYIEFNVYNDDTGNEQINANISHKRVNALKKYLVTQKINKPVKINYKGMISISNGHLYTKKDLQQIRNKNRRIDIIVITVDNNLKNEKNIINTSNIKKEVTLTEKNNKLPIYYGTKNNTVIDENTKKEILSSIKNIDTKKIKSIALNVYNDDSGDKTKDDQTSKKRAEELKKIISQNIPDLKIIVQYKGNIKTEAKKAYINSHVEYLRNKNRRIDIVANYSSLNSDISSLNLEHAFSPDNKAGDRIYLKHGSFKDNQSTLTNEIARELDILALQLNKYKKLQVEIQGHICCTNGGHEALDKATGKLELSTNRAKTVYNYLIKKNVDPKRLRYKGLGNQKPLGVGIDEQLNKRIELYIFRASL